MTNKNPFKLTVKDKPDNVGIIKNPFKVSDRPANTPTLSVPEQQVKTPEQQHTNDTISQGSRYSNTKDTEKKTGILGALSRKNEIARSSLPTGAESSFRPNRLAEPTTRDRIMESEKAKQSVFRGQRKEENIKQVTDPVEKYTPPNNFLGKLKDTMKYGNYIGNVWSGFIKPAIGTVSEQAGISLDSPKLRSWGEQFADKAMERESRKASSQSMANVPPALQGGLVDPRYYAKTISQAMGYMSAVLGTSIAVTAATKNPVSGTAAAFTVGASLESANAYRSMLDKGVSPEEANTGAQIYGVISSAIENATGIKPAVGIKGLIEDFAVDAAKNSGVKNFIKKWVEEGVIEEGSQQLVQNLVTKFIDKNQKVFEGVAESMVGGLVGALPMVGGGAVISNIQQKQTQKQTQKTTTNIPVSEGDKFVLPQKRSDFNEIKFTKTAQEVRRDLKEIFGIEPDLLTTKFEENMVAKGAVGQVDADGTIRLLSENNKVSDVVAKHEAVHWIKRNVADKELLGEINDVERQLIEMFPEKVARLESSYSGVKANIGEELLSDELALFRETGKTFSEKAKLLFRKILQKLEYLFKGKKDIITFFNNLKDRIEPAQINTQPARLFNNAVPLKIDENKKEIPINELVPDSTKDIDSPIGISEKARQEEVQGLAPEIAEQIDPLEKIVLTEDRTPANQKVNWFDYLRTPWRVFEKMGIRPAYQELLTGYNAYMKELPKNIDKITAWSERVSKESNQRIFQFLDGKKIELNEEEAMVAQEIKDWLAEWADRLGVDPDSRITDYITHIFPQNEKGEIPEEIAFMISKKTPGSVYNPFLLKRLGAEGYIEDTWGALDAYVKRATRKVNMDPGLKVVKEASKKLTNTEQIDYIDSYLSSINFRPNKSDSLIDNFIRQHFGYTFSARPTAAMTRLARMTIARAKIAFSAVSFAKNLTQGVNTYGELGEKYTLLGYINLVKFGAKELEEEGVLISSFIEDRKYSAIKSAMEKFDKVAFANMNASELVNRGAAYYGAKAKFLNGKITSKKYKMAFGKEMPKDYKPTVEDAKEYGAFIANKTQFKFGALDTPQAMNSDLMKMFFQFQTFSLKQAEYIGQMIKDKELAELTRYMVSSALLFGLVGKAFGMAWDESWKVLRWGYPPIVDFFKKLWEEGVLGTDKYGNVLNNKEKMDVVGKTLFTNVVPGGAQLERSYSGLKTVGEGTARTRSGNFKFNVGQDTENYIRGGLFGPYNLPESQKYYKEQDEKKKENAKKRADLEKRRKLFDKRVKSSNTAKNPFKVR